MKIIKLGEYELHKYAKYKPPRYWIQLRKGNKRIAIKCTYWEYNHPLLFFIEMRDYLK